MPQSRKEAPETSNDREGWPEGETGLR
jgi:hypothetical protein